MWLAIMMLIAMSALVSAQNVNSPKPEKGSITDTVMDPNNDIVSGATVVLVGPMTDRRTMVSDDNGFFAFNDLDPGTYAVSISAKGFAKWTSPTIIVQPGQYIILTGSKLKIADELTTVSVAYSPIDVATEQVKIAEQQRVFG